MHPGTASKRGDAAAGRGKILVTGGAGYVGSHTCKALAAQGYDPVVFDSLETGHRGAVKWGCLVRGSLRDKEHLLRTMEHHRVVAVLHFAASAYVAESVSDPAKYYRNNVGGTINLLDAMRESGPGHIVFSSSCATYGVPESTPISEQASQDPVSPYGRSKLMIERILTDYSAAYGIGACSLRYFNAAGADPDGEIGERHDPEPHLIPSVLRVGRGGNGSVKVFGGDYPTRDGTCVRDFVHVADLAEAHCLALQYLIENRGYHAFNLGSGEGYSVMEVIKAAESEIGRPVPFTVEQRRLGDPPVLVADSSRAERELGWVRNYSSLGEILGTAWRWECSGVSLD
ncbi:MAG: UDP-glucose 4-epimerase GalE [Arenicellales bacterium]|jgi:UDP-glucose-4-epimerase GalE